MVKAWKNKSSKRITARQRYRIEKKIKDASKKARKEARANPQQQKKSKKDPGIPSLWPYKEKLLDEIEQNKRKVEEAKERQKKLRSDALNRSRDMDVEEDDELENLEQLVESAQSRTTDFEVTAQEEEEQASGNHKDNSLKAYYREFKKVVEAADVILEVLDARDPAGCRCKEVEQTILAAGPRKRIVLILNKIDLVPREAVEAWLKYFRNEFPCVAFKASTQSQRKNLGQAQVSTKNATDDMLNSSESIGADSLIKLLKNYSRSLNLKTSISVGVIGLPNVGKSSVINSLKRSRAAGVGATPGFTKVMQEIILDKNIKLLDCPGIVFANNGSDAEILLRNAVKVEQLDDPSVPVELIISRCRKELLMLLYNIPSFSTTVEFLMHVAKQRGKLKKGGIADLETAARSVLQDWNSGRIPFYTMPPKRDEMISSQVVTSWAPEFDPLGESITEDSMALDAAGNGVSGDFVDLLPAAEATLVSSSAPAKSGKSTKASADDMEAEDEDDMPIEEEEPLFTPMDISDDLLPKIDSALTKKLKKKVKGAVEAPSKRQEILSREEEELNPQIGKSLKKNAKKAKKLAKKSQAVEDEEASMAPYDFGSDFTHVASADFVGVEDAEEDLGHAFD